MEFHVRLRGSNQYCNRVDNCSVQCMNWTRNPATTVCLVYTPGTCAEITSVCDSLTSLWSALNPLIATNCVDNRSYFAGGENVYPVGLHN